MGIYSGAPCIETKSAVLDFVVKLTHTEIFPYLLTVKSRVTWPYSP